MIYTSPLLKAADGSPANTLLNMLAFQTMTLDGWTYDGIRSPYWRIYWNCSEGAAIEVGGKRYELGPEQFLVIPSETSFRSMMQKPVEHFYVHFLMATPWRRNGVEVVPATRSEQSLVRSFFREAHNEALHWRVLSLTASLLGRLPVDGWERKADPDHDARIQETIDTINSRSPSLISVARLAKIAGMNINSFIRLFRQRTGMTPGRYMLERRIDTACLMLHHSDKNIDEIAEVCGFCDRFHFSHAFTRSRGNTPARFRRQLQAGAL